MLTSSKKLVVPKELFVAIIRVFLNNAFRKESISITAIHAVHRTINSNSADVFGNKISSGQALRLMHV